MTLVLVKDYDADGHSSGFEHTAVQETLRRLQHVPARRWIYLRIARRACKATKLGKAFMLTHAEFRLLSSLTEWANRDLSNCFPGIRLLVKREGWNERHVKKLLASLVNKGWIRNRTLRYRGKRATGRQFAIPAGVLAQWADEWLGPRDFSKAID